MAIYRGSIVEINSRGIYVEIPALAIGMHFGPCEAIPGVYSIGNNVLCNQVDGAREDIVVIGNLSLGYNLADIDNGLEHKRQDTASWASETVPLKPGQLGINTDTGEIRAGDGIHTDFADLPHLPSVTKISLGLENIDNTSDLSKPISTATQTALNTKVDKVGSVDIEITDATKGLILKSPNGTRYRLTVNNAGTLTTTVV